MDELRFDRGVARGILGGGLDKTESTEESWADPSRRTALMIAVRATDTFTRSFNAHETIEFIMQLTPTPTGDSFFDPPPSDQSAVTLILGGERLDCHLVEVSIGGFGVMVPRSTAWEGEPICKLLTYDAAYPVRIIKQEAQYDGFHMTLQRIQEQDIKPGESTGATQNWIVNASRCCAVGLIAAIGYCFVATPGGISTGARTIHARDVANLWNQTWNLSNWWPTSGGSTATKTESAAATSAHKETADGLFELPAISVSLASKDHSTKSNRSIGQSDIDPQAQAVAVATRKAQIKSSLLTARRGPNWPADSTTLPWLFPTNDPTLNSGPACRMSDAARNDLNLFESGLKSLTAATAGDAIRSLRRALAATSSTTTVASHLVSQPFESLPDVKLIRSADAEIYFHPMSDLVEILRVVPRDSHEPHAARPTSPTSSLAPQSMSR